MTNEPSLTLVCRNCGLRYTPGQDAIIVTAGYTLQAILGRELIGLCGPGAEAKRAEFSSRGTLATFGDPDLIMLRDWSGIAEVEKAALFSLVNQILKSEEAPRRTWMCEECHTEQDYPFADAAAIDALSVDQQKALFIRLSALYTMAHENAQSHCTGSSCPPQVPTQVAQWALPYKERIRHAEALARRDGDFDRALVELLALQEVLPTAAIVLMDIGACHGEKQQNAEALSWLEKALQFVPPEYEHRVQQNIACIESRLEEQR